MRHGWAQHPLFTLEALADAADRLPPTCIEVRSSANVHGGAFPRQAAAGAGDIIRTIGTSDRWVMLRGIEQLPKYGHVIAEGLADAERVIAAATGAPRTRQSFVFISSPGLLTPLHFDPEYNLFFQIFGHKQFALLPAAAPWISEEAVERFRATGDNLIPCSRDVEEAGVIHDVAPGDGLYVPYCAPHWVRVGDQPSVSLSLTWTTRWAQAHEHSQRLASLLRRFRIPVPAIRGWPHTSWTQAAVGRLLARVMP